MPMIQTLGTEFHTENGNKALFVPHRKHPSGFMAPVRIIVTGVVFGMKVIEPERDARGRFVYALPGGGKWIP